MTATAGDHWDGLCDRLRALGGRVAEGGGGAAGEVERYEHLVDQVTLWLGWAVLHDNPGRPFFHRHNDLVSQWGGPNNDNVYRHARIEPGRRYVVRGRMHGCDDFLLAVRKGFMHRPEWGTVVQLTASDLGIGPGDDFELHFGGDDPDAIELPDGAVMISVREYYFDWREEEPATFTIECLDPGPPVLFTADRLGTGLDEAVAEITDSITYWDAYMADNRADRVDNTFDASSVAVAKGLSVARYEFCFWYLGPDEALLIECDRPDARYWSAQIYAMHTFEPIDPYGAVTSRNHLQSEVSADGRLRYVVSGHDPGVANWLDTGGRRNGLCTLRWFWPHSDDRPEVATRVVDVARIADHLPPDTPTVTEQERAEELAARQAHLRWRFRT